MRAPSFAVRWFLRTLPLGVFAGACGGKIIATNEDGGAVLDAATETDSQTEAPPPACKPNNSACATATECCGGACTANLCRTKVSCTPASGKLCDQCMALTAECCSEILVCQQDAVCAQWLACIQQCEQAGSSALACLQGPCPAKGWQAGNLWYNVQYYCPVCSQD